MHRFTDGVFYPYAMRDAYEKAGTWPDNGVDVDGSVFDAFKKTDNPGKVIGTDDRGYPCWIDAPAPSLEERTQYQRANRDRAILSSGWIVERHRDELEAGITTTLSAEHYAELQSYRQQLRDWPAQPGWPDIDMPPQPEWLAPLLK